MPRRTIALDFDDVLVDFNSGFVNYHNRVHGTALAYEDLYTYEMEVLYNCDTPTLIERVVGFYHSPDHEEIAPIPGSSAALDRLQKMHTLEVVTSRAETLRERTNSLILRHFPDTIRQIHFTNGFAADPGARKRFKSEVCKEIDAFVLVEDALKHATDVARSGVPVLLPDRPWNQGDVPEGVTRVHSWDEITDWIEANA